MNAKLIPIHEPIAWTASHTRSGEDLYQRRLQQTRKMIALRERDIPGFTRHAPSGLAGITNPPSGSRADA